MKIEAKKVASDPFEALTPTQKACYAAAVVIAFVSIFVWLVVILFF
jgi:hypothetical protein